ncbi:YjbF family lipoprotein [Epibacterium sp. Ofav1-8]|uniref:YjbF family lipoprotein n=1 Tax=Epibacterium sp. Ofav1-8 TaxID=2917735 RepID=UPI001EF58E00|nr:YjbF family lipoprotein [Epibacterium sp. Ofav1-8]MCG7626012.1 YjbF family lipoprotein [Epibacterium sp. Ofav1-8]
MRHLLRHIPAALLGLTVLAGCARGPEDTPLELEIGQVLREQLPWGKEKPQPPTLTRVLLDSIEEPHLEVVIESEDLRDYVTLQLARQDDLPGRIEVWRTVDNITFGFRDGLLISTRGLRGTLLSADVPADGQGPRGPAGGGQRSYEFRGDDSASYRVRLACEVKDLGAHELEIVGLRYATRHVQERCTGPQGGHVVNDYWVDSRSGRLWQSRQWAGPEVGYIRLRQVVI